VARSWLGEEKRSLELSRPVNRTRSTAAPNLEEGTPAHRRNSGPGQLDPTADLRLPVVRSIVVLHGDQTGEELLIQALRLFERDLIGLDLNLRHFDLSLARRRQTCNQVVLEAAGSLREAGFGIKAATITPEGSDDVGSPNAILRQAVDGRVIVRTGRRIPGVRPPAPVYSPISVIRMAVDDAYGASEWRDGDGLAECAYRTEKISRHTCRIVAEYAFQHANRVGARVFGGPK